MKLLGAYKNGNYNCRIYEDGTKIRYTSANEFKPKFPESIDMKISDRCDRNCPMCHECSTPNGALANLNSKLFDSLKPYTELALGGGNVLEHPDLVPFLTRMRDKHIICNMTLHLEHYLQNLDLIEELIHGELIHGIGVSVDRPVQGYEKLALTACPNLVVHVIAGLVTGQTLNSLSGLKILMLGYKTWGRGKNFRKEHPELQENIEYLADNFNTLKEQFPLVSFDNLALEQLHVRARVSEEEWKKNYMGDDGQFTMYIDMVQGKYAVSSISERYKIDSLNVEDLFREVRRRSGYA